MATKKKTTKKRASKKACACKKMNIYSYKSSTGTVRDLSGLWRDGGHTKGAVANMAMQRGAIAAMVANINTMRGAGYSGTEIFRIFNTLLAGKSVRGLGRI